MNIIEEYFKNRSEILNKHRMQPLLNPVDVKETNPWYIVFISNLNSLVEELSEGSMTFCINTDPRVQACAIHDDQLIVLTAGMFDMLCKLASSIVSAEIYPEIGSENSPTWKPDTSNCNRPVRKLLDQNPFNWKLKPAWSNDLDRMELFFQILSSMTRFVVLHEAGHLWHKHGTRNKYHNRLEIDTIGANILKNSQEALESQARELVADQFAFRQLLRALNNEVKHPTESEHRRNLRSALLSSEINQITFTLLTAYFYFYSVDTSNWNISEAHLYTHPPAPFRLKAILCDLLEFGALGLNPYECENIIYQANLTAEAIISITFKNFPDIDWLKSMSDDRLQNHFNNLCAEIPNWYRKN